MTDLTVRTTKRRLDLQALRAFAVVAVMLNHSWPGLAPGGFLGVDIFLVPAIVTVAGLAAMPALM